MADARLYETAHVATAIARASAKEARSGGSAVPEAARLLAELEQRHGDSTGLLLLVLLLADLVVSGARAVELVGGTSVEEYLDSIEMVTLRQEARQDEEEQ